MMKCAKLYAVALFHSFLFSSFARKFISWVIVCCLQWALPFRWVLRNPRQLSVHIVIREWVVVIELDTSAALLAYQRDTVRVTRIKWLQNENKLMKYWNKRRWFSVAFICTFWRYTLVFALCHLHHTMNWTEHIDERAHAHTHTTNSICLGANTLQQLRNFVFNWKQIHFILISYNESCTYYSRSSLRVFFFLVFFNNHSVS